MSPLSIASGASVSVVIWADLTKFDLRPGTHPDNIKLSGDVSGKFQRAKATPF
jgi:hypothetical protein